MTVRIPNFPPETWLPDHLKPYPDDTTPETPGTPPLPDLVLSDLPTIEVRGGRRGGKERGD